MAFAVLRNATGDTTGGSVVTSTAFTPGVGELLVAFVSLISSGSDSIRPALVGSNGLSFSRQSVYWGGSSENFMAIYIADGVVGSAASMTVSIDWGVNVATGASFVVAGIQGLQKVGGPTGGGVGEGAMAHNGSNTNGVSSVPTYSTAPALSVDNLIMTFVASFDNPPTVTAPTGFIAFSSVGHATPAAGIQVVQRQYGGAPAALAWGSAATGPYGSLYIEFACDNLDSTDRPQFVLGSGI